MTAGRAPKLAPQDRRSPRQRARGAAESKPTRKPRRRWWLFLLRWSLILAIWGTVLIGLVLAVFAWDLPRPSAALDAARRPGVTLQDSAGRIIATYGDLVGEPLRLADMPPYLPAAAVAVEDRRFYSHAGLDLIGIARAMLVNIQAGQVVQGGSTITQQVAKNLFLTNARTFRRKVQELLLTLWLERQFSKQEILEIWLNRVYLGSGAFGVDAAARIYFGISARKVNLWQAAVLAGLPRAPSRINPRVNPEAAAARGREVLAAMAETGAIGAELASVAASQIAFPPRPSRAAGWFGDWVSDQAEPLLPDGADAVVRTTLDARIQAIVETRLKTLLDGPGAEARVGQGAVVVLDAATGRVRALVGGKDFATSSFNRAVVARRQPGSAFKPFVWLAAIEAGARPDDTVLDAPIRRGRWAPANFDNRFRGEITLEEALAHSVNTAAVRLLIQAGGPRAVAAAAARLGIADPLPNNESLALGTTEVGLLELTAAYASFFNGGLRITPTGIEGVVAERRNIALTRTAPARAITPDHAAMMARMLAAVVSRGSGRAAAIPGRAVAGKTGTTQDYRDAWFIGWTEGAAGTGGSGGRMIGIWLGNDDNRPMDRVTGGSLPARLFAEIAREIGAN
ncbi:MAG: PBP1A family penicillin-binding protein [Acetobacteraceae bacterium]|nr:PBP1A family penicillin-binding protein [Acetobacteraceae bacterium]